MKRFWFITAATTLLLSVVKNNEVSSFSSPTTKAFPKKKKKKIRIATTSPRPPRRQQNPNQNNKEKNRARRKKKLPEAAFINRRKSPALWRDDLTTASLQNNNTTATQEGEESHNFCDDDDDNNLLLLPLRPPEVMAPVGGFPQLKAAIANGADSVYLGLTAFSARARASNFDPDELRQAVKIAHESNVRVFVALNTLVFQRELHEVAEWIALCDDAGVDALIVQDIGVAKMAQRVAPALEIHASTQQTVTNTDGVMYAKERTRATRVVLGRELSVKEIRSVKREMMTARRERKRTRTITDETTTKHQQHVEEEEEDVEVEVFVHGALCVSYSGQCFSSEAWGGRSANRGQCAQACRLPYGLIRNGELVDLQDMSYLLSPQDLCGLDQVEALVNAGVSCLKIEGRLKDEKYVAATTRAYRNAVDVAWEKVNEKRKKLQRRRRNNGDDDSSIIATTNDDSHRRVLESHETVSKPELAQLFSRGQDEQHNGLTPGFFEGSHHQRLVIGRSPRHRGTHVGRVAEGSSWRNGIVIVPSSDSSAPLKRGDGIVIDRGMPQEEELGGPIFEIEQTKRSNKLVVRLGREVEKRWKRIDDAGRRTKKPLLAPPGAHVWKTSDASVDKKMKRLIEAAPPRRLVEVSVSGEVGTPLTVTIVDPTSGCRGVGQTDGVLAPAEKKGLDEPSIKKAIGTLGNTVWSLDDDEGGIDTKGLDFESSSWCPISWVKKARQQAVNDLEEQIRKKKETNGDDEQSSNKKIANKSQQHNDNNLDRVVEEMLEEAAGSAAPSRDMIHHDKKEKTKKKTSVSVLGRNYDQINGLCEMVEQQQHDGSSTPMIDEIIIDFLEVDGMQQAVRRIRQTTTEGRVRVVLASPRIIKPGEEGIWRTLLRLEPDGLLIRSQGLVHKMMQLGGTGATVDVGTSSGSHLVKIPELIGDFSLNAVNSITANEFLEYGGGLSRITTAYDLSADAITELAGAMGPTRAARLEVVAHAHLPIFHTEHCVFARFLSKGNSYLDCGHVCTRNNVHLRDQSGNDNLVLADMGCRNTVFAAEAQSGVHSLRQWQDVGIGRIRIELVDESASDATKIVKGYLGVLSGKQRAGEVWDSLKHIKDSNGRKGGVSHGSLRNTSERRAGEL